MKKQTYLTIEVESIPPQLMEVLRVECHIYINAYKDSSFLYIKD